MSGTNFVKYALTPGLTSADRLVILQRGYKNNG